MTKDVNYHEGHRERIKDKFLANPESLSTYEIVELLLFYAIPRKDTNIVAHKLCKVFPSLNSILNADKKALLSIDGVGKNSTVLFSLLKEVVRRSNYERDTIRSFYTFNDYKEYVISYFSAGLSVEKAVVFLFDIEHKLSATYTFAKGVENRVNIELEKLLDVITTYKPKFLVLAHNHPNGITSPSPEDDLTTAKINLLCYMHGVKMLDHIIVYGKKYYSYYMSGALKEKFFDDEVKKILESANDLETSHEQKYVFKIDRGENN